MAKAWNTPERRSTRACTAQFPTASSSRDGYGSGLFWAQMTMTSRRPAASTPGAVARSADMATSSSGPRTLTAPQLAGAASSNSLSKPGSVSSNSAAISGLCPFWTAARCQPRRFQTLGNGASRWGQESVTIRCSGPSASTSEYRQSPEGRWPGRGYSVARPGLLMNVVAERGIPEGRRARLRSDWRWRLLNELFALFVALLFLLAAVLVLLDSAPGHRFIVDQLGKLETASGLRIQVGRIDGSLFGKSDLRNVSVADQRGVFLTSPDIRLDWTPGAWLYHKLSISSVAAQRVTLDQLPILKPSSNKGPILPGFDIHIGELRIRRLNLGPEVSGRPRSGRLWAKADVRSGRALVEVQALLNNGGDRITFHLDTEPDHNKFELGTSVISPADGLLPAMIGAKRAITLSISGRGSWTRWRGTAALDLSGRAAARLALGVDRGQYPSKGTQLLLNSSPASSVDCWCRS